MNKNSQNPVESLHSDQAVMAEMKEKCAQKSLLFADKLPPGSISPERYLENPTPAESVYQTERIYTEAIVQVNGRPSLLIQNGQINQDDLLQTWRDRLNPYLNNLQNNIFPSVGRIELLNHFNYDWVGTGWIIEENILVTNRHVAEIFAMGEGSNFTFRRNFMGTLIEAKIDFKEEYQRDEEREIQIEKILYVAPSSSSYPDVAFLQFRSSVNTPPLELVTQDVIVGNLVGVIGYPAFDSRNDGAIMARIFRDIYDVKRFAPGEATAIDDDSILNHDCSTLGGNSGSAVIDLESGKVAGLHYAGRFLVNNYAVKASVLNKILSALKPTFGITTSGSDRPLEAEVEEYQNREGYQENFLGNAPEFEVSLPELSATIKADAVKVKQERGIAAYVLDYTHFSLVMSKSRRLAYYTAVNIDGNQEKAVRRRGTRWKLDPRIPVEYQADNSLYRNNDLDRGHLVRRLDPVWGSDDIAKQANQDTFHYTNAAPQHRDLNQRVWLELENYLLDNANNRDLKISVFTGCIFNPQDIEYRGVKIPEEFWKVVAMVNTATGRLHATGYILSQRRFIDNLEFVFGGFKTYQVTISSIEAETGLNFGNLKDFDPLREREGFGSHAINRKEDLVM